MNMGKKENEGVVSSALFNSLPIGVVYYNTSGKIMAANPAASEILGKEPASGLDFFELMGKVLTSEGDDFPREQQPCLVSLKSGLPVKDVVMGIFHNRDKTYRWVNVNAVPEFTEGEQAPSRIYTTLTDVTNTVLVSRKLQRSEERYRTLVDNMHSGLVIIQNGLIKYVNPAVLRKTGYTEQEILGSMFNRFIDPDERERVEQFHLKRLAHDDAPVQYRTRLYTKDKRFPWFDISAKTIEYDGKPGVLVILSDVDLQVGYEKKLKRSELRFRSLFQNAPIGIALVDERGKLLEVNDKLTQITG